MNKFEESHFLKFINFIHDPVSGCLEFVAWKSMISKTNMIEPAATYPRVIGSWYDRLDCLRRDVRRLRGVSGYMGINPISKDLLARSANKASVLKKSEGTKEENIKFYRNFLIDIDCERIAGVSATDEELSRALAVRDRILDCHPEICDNSIWGCSGNGAYIIVRMGDLPNDKTTKEIVKHTLRSLANEYGKKDRDQAYVDTNTHSPIFHAGVPGTYKCKGNSTEERPHRLITVDGVGRLVLPE